eukprot:COSAG01_NODE_1256_length_11028_cov_10.728279_2_plen_61_part_00
MGERIVGTRASAGHQPLLLGRPASSQDPTAAQLPRELDLGMQRYRAMSKSTVGSSDRVSS